MKNIKIGIISVDINTPKFNYGAILHTWAFEEFLKKSSFTKYENINYLPEELMHQHRLFPFLDLLSHTHRRLSLRYTTHYVQYLRKYKKIKRFCDCNMINTPKVYTYNNIKNEKLDYDVLIAEDDVIWAPQFLCKSEVVDKTFFLAHENMMDIRKISYAPSMSDCHFESKDFSLLRSYLEKFEQISVRETYAVDFIKNNLALNAVAVLDAVFLLDSIDYSQIISDRFLDKDPYILLYLPAEDNLQLRQEAEKYARSHNLQIIEVTNRIISYQNIYGDCGVEDFLSAIKYASIVLTNSFHALCFSIIFEKDFYVFSRKFNGKNEDLCRRFGIEDRYCPKVLSDEPVNYSLISNEIELQKKNSREWLLKAIEGVC